MKWSIRVFITVLVLCNVSLLGVTNTKWLRPHKQSPVQQKVLPMSAIYISKTGSDGGTGAIDSPFRTLEKALDIYSAADDIYFEGGKSFYFGEAVLTSDTATVGVGLDTITCTNDVSSTWIGMVVFEDVTTCGDGFGYRIIDANEDTKVLTLDRLFVSAGATTITIQKDFALDYLTNYDIDDEHYFRVGAYPASGFSIVGSYGTGRATLIPNNGTGLQKAWCRPTLGLLQLQDLIIAPEVAWEGAAIFLYPIILKGSVRITNCKFTNIGGCADYEHNQRYYTIIDGQLISTDYLVATIDHCEFTNMPDVALGAGVVYAGVIHSYASINVCDNWIHDITTSYYNFYALNGTNLHADHNCIARLTNGGAGKKLSACYLGGGQLIAFNYSTVYDLVANGSNLTAGIEVSSLSGQLSAHHNVFCGSPTVNIDFGIHQASAHLECNLILYANNFYRVTTPYGTVQEIPDAALTYDAQFHDAANDNFRITNPLLYDQGPVDLLTGNTSLLGACTLQRSLSVGANDVSTGL